MLKELFTSEIRIQLLTRFLMHPEVEYYGRELTEILGASSRSVHAELKNLESIALIQKRISGKQHYYSANTRHPLFRDLQNIFRKTIGLKDAIAEGLKSIVEDIDYAFIYGSFVSGDFKAESDVDLLLIGDVSSRKLSNVLLEVGETIEREVNYSIFKRNEFTERLRTRDHFISRIIATPMLFIIGDSNEFRSMAEKWMAQGP